MKLLATNLLVLLGLSVVQGYFSYDGYKVYRITVASSKERDLLRDFEDDLRFDFWSTHHLSHVPLDIMVSPDGQYEFETFLDTHTINYKTLIDNVKDVVQREKERQTRSPKVARGEVTFTEYMRHDEINSYLERLAQDYPDIVTTEVIGKSLEGRDLTIIRISSGGINKPTIFADAAIHAREWIAPPVALYVINQLVENPDNRHLFENVDWVFIPVANPDGYEFTHTDERMWRKTTSAGTICNGADPNRNFDFHWRESGASIWQCYETYAGRAAFSEVETQALRDYLLAHKNDIKLYVALHSYGGWLLYPWGYALLLPDNAEELQTVGDLFKDAVVAAGGEEYEVGNAVEVLYAAAGASDDYAKGVVGVDLSYTLELPGGGEDGFDLPPEDILHTVQETFEGFRALHQYVENKYTNNLS